MIVIGKIGTPVIMLLLILSPFYLAAQESAVFKGKVTDAVTGAPVAAASVFINNSTYVRICDERGIFELQQFPPPPFEVTITAIGYEAAFMKISGKPGAPLSVRLKPKAVNLGEITVLGPEKDGWQKYGKQFLDDFIGYSPFAAACELLNREAVQFRYNKDENTLSVWAQEPLKIRNKATGYLITYWLDDFEKNYSTKKLYFKGYTLFTELTAKKEKEKAKWVSQRQSAYRGSLNHFMRSLYQGHPEQEGFEIRKLVRVMGSDYGRYVPVTTDTILTTDMEQLRRIFLSIFGKDADQQVVTGTMIRLLQWKNDSSRTDPLKIVPPLLPPDTVQHKEYIFSKIGSDKERFVVRYFDWNRDPPEDRQDSIARKSGIAFGMNGNTTALSRLRQQRSYDMLYTGILNIDSLVHTESPGSIQFLFPGYLHITYTREQEEVAYLKRQFPFKNITPGNQTSIISLSNEKGITVYPDGNFTLSYDLLAEEYWSYEKLDKLLPLDYHP